MRCTRCSGLGKYRGLGYVEVICPCTLPEKKDDKVIQASVSIDKRVKSYKDAIKNIMAADDIDRETAEKIFEEEFNKLG